MSSDMSIHIYVAYYTQVGLDVDRSASIFGALTRYVYSDLSFYTR